MVLELLLEVDVPVDIPVDAPVDVPVEMPVAVVLVLLLLLLLSDRVALTLYVESLLGPPQYSNWSPLQSIEHPLAAGSLPPGARMDPAPNTLPQ